MSGGGFLNGIHGAAKAERARTAAVEEQDHQVRSKSQALTVHRQVDNFERRVAKLMPELLVERQEFTRSTSVVERLVGENGIERANERGDVVPEPSRYAPPPSSGVVRRGDDPFFSPLPPTQGTLPSSPSGPASGPLSDLQSSRFSDRDFDYERSLDALHLIGGTEEQQAAAINAATPLLEALENVGQMPLSEAARQFIESNTSYDLATGRDEVSIERMIAQLNGIVPASISDGSRRALLEAMSGALTVVAPSNSGDVSNALKLAFAPKEIFNVEAISEATEAISSSPESEQSQQMRIQEERDRKRRDFVERVRREKKKRKRRLDRGSEDSTVSGLFRR